MLNNCHSGHYYYYFAPLRLIFPSLLGRAWSCPSTSAWVFISFHPLHIRHHHSLTHIFSCWEWMVDPRDDGFASPCFRNQLSCENIEHQYLSALVISNKRQNTSLVDAVPSTAHLRGSMDSLSWMLWRGHGSRTVPWTCDWCVMAHARRSNFTT